MFSRKHIRAKLNLPTRVCNPDENVLFQSLNRGLGRGNWGDHVSVEICQKYFADRAFEVTHDPLVRGKYMTIGSILSHLLPGDSIWGAGCIKLGATGNHRGNLKVHAVRGPLTKRELEKDGISVPEIFGDPALLISDVVPSPTATKTHRWGVIPHWIDLDKPEVQRLKELGFEIIDIRSKTEDLVQSIHRVDRILSSSLHGLIVSDAYRIPNARVTFGNDIIGGDFKFEDYRLSVQRKMPNLRFTLATTVEQIERHQLNDSIQWSSEKLLENAPFKS